MTGLLENATVVDIILPALLALLGWLGHKLAKLLDGRWASAHLGAVASHARDATAAALGAYRERLRDARGSDSDGGAAITPAERDRARKAAKAAFLGAIGLDQLARALSISRGRKVSTDDAQAWGESLVDRAVNADPFVTGSTK